jgi:Tol biopolymer transport system component
VAFVSNATDLLPAGSPTVTGQQIYVHDRQLGVMSLVSRNNSGAPATAGSINISPSVNGNGRFVAFISDATNLGATGTQVYLHDTQVGGQTILISKNNDPTPAQGNGDSSTPSISSDGCFVAFASAATNLGDPVANQIHVRGPLAIVSCSGTEQTSLVSKSTSGVTSNGLINSSPAVSGNGRFIAFVSDATNLGAAGTQVYLRDTQGGGQTTLISKDNVIPTPGNGVSATPSISSDGCFVAFGTTSTNLGSSANQIYVRGPLAIASCAGTEQTSLVSKDSSGNPANGAAGSTVDPSINGNGQFVAFSSSSTNLFSPPPGGRQIYVRALP